MATVTDRVTNVVPVVGSDRPQREVLLTFGSQQIRMTPHEALRIARDLTTQADALLVAP